jgi:hypothetical protein
MTVTRYRKKSFPYEWPMAHREDALLNMMRNLFGCLGLYSRLSHDERGSLWLAHETRQRYGMHAWQHEGTRSIACRPV